MPTIKLTTAAIEAEPVTTKDAYLWDSSLPRFGVRVTPAGARIYLVQYRARTVVGQPTKTRRITLGQHGKGWGIERARAEARTLLARVDLGGDPFVERELELEARIAAAEAARQEVQAAELRRRDTFAAVAERYILAALKTNRSGDETARLLRFDPVPAWRNLHIGQIRRGDVAELMDKIKARSPAVCRATYAALRGLFSWCVERDLIAASPCDGVTAPPRTDARDRVLADGELAAIWRASDELGFPFGPAVKLLMLTGQRRTEVAEMAWGEVDLEAATWRIPKERTKNGKAHEVDLPPQALAILKKLERGGPHVFPARQGGGGHVTAEPREPGGVQGFSAAKRKLDQLLETARLEADPPAEPPPPWRLHDLRRTAATGMAGMSFPPHVVERVLNHVSGAQSGLVGVYQRHEYRGERKAALTAWGAHVEAIVTGSAPASNVRRLRSRG